DGGLSAFISLIRSFLHGDGHFRSTVVDGLRFKRRYRIVEINKYRTVRGSKHRCLYIGQNADNLTYFNSISTGIYRCPCSLVIPFTLTDNGGVPDSDRCDTYRICKFWLIKLDRITPVYILIGHALRQLRSRFIDQSDRLNGSIPVITTVHGNEMT